jgi:hypothetical protein
MSTPTESSVADQMARLLPSQVGSRVFNRAESSTVLTIEQAVTLRGVSQGKMGKVWGMLTPSRDRTLSGDPTVCGGKAV